jgi:hypothetical protein
MLLVGLALVLIGLAADIAPLWMLGVAVAAVGAVVVVDAARRVGSARARAGARGHLRVVE